MDHMQLIDRIIKDAQTQATTIINDAKNNAKKNIDYAKSNAESVVQNARETAKRNRERELEILSGTRDIQNRLITLRQKTQIVDDVFDRALDTVKFNFRTVDHANYELHLTRQELKEDLRDQIEPQVVRILFGETK